MKQSGRFPAAYRPPVREDDLDMTTIERERSAILRKVRRGALTLEQATSVMRLSYRQAKRVWKRYLTEGDDGLVHRSRGKPSNRAFPEAFKADVLRRYRELAGGSGLMRFTEKLECAGISIDHETLRRWLLESGLWTPRRTRRLRTPAVRPDAGFGELLTLVSRRGPWLGGHRPDCFLLCLVDEASDVSLCALAPEESCCAAMRLLWSWVDRHGVPAAVRSPRRFTRDELRHPSLEQQLAGGEPHTAFFQSCERLGIETRVLHAAQEKKRLAGLQTVMEAARGGLRRHGGSTPEEGTSLLEGDVGAELNARYAERSRPSSDCHVPIMDRTDLRTVFCTRHERPVRPGLVVEHDHRRFRLEQSFGGEPRPIHRVVVSEWMDGSIHVLLGASELPFQELTPACPPVAYRAM
jgi:transposase